MIGRRRLNKSRESSRGELTFEGIRAQKGKVNQKAQGLGEGSGGD